MINRSRSRSKGRSLSPFKREVRKLLKKHKKSALAKSIARKKGSRKKRKKSLSRYRLSTRRNNNNISVNGGAVRDGSPQQFLKC